MSRLGKSAEIATIIGTILAGIAIIVSYLAWRKPVPPPVRDEPTVTASAENLEAPATQSTTPVVESQPTPSVTLIMPTDTPIPSTGTPTTPLPTFDVFDDFLYEDRWTSITDRLGLYNPSYDAENHVPMTDYDRKVRIGNNVVVVFSSNDIDKDYERVRSLGATGITDIVQVNLMAPYRFFQFYDTEGNIIEVGRMG